MKQKIITLILLMACTSCVWGINYKIHDDGTAMVCPFYQKGDVSDTLLYEGDLVLPAEIEYNGTAYKVTSLDTYAFYSCYDLTSITIPEGVTSMGDNVFMNCSGLTSISLPESMTSIGDGIFTECPGIKDLVYNKHCFVFLPPTYTGNYDIPEGIEMICGFAFSSCSGLTSVSIPESVTTIGTGAFDGCSGLTSISIPEGVTQVSRSAFYGCEGLDFPIYNNRSFISLPTSFKGNYTIPEGIEAILDYAFSDCTGLTSVTIPEEVNHIGDHAFASCSALTSVTIRGRGTSIGIAAFEYCHSLTSVILHEGVTSLADAAFYCCEALSTITIPASMVSMGEAVFVGSENINSIVCLATVPPAATEFTFMDCNATLHVLPGKKSVYESADGWRVFTNIIEDAEEASLITALSVSSDSPLYDLGGHQITGPRENKILIRNGKKFVVTE